ncbi:MAG: hypothetical protein OXI77_07155 [Chloroflexota bacterium]|nr:hypothetical protein [Chloroflexota bacterium]
MRLASVYFGVVGLAVAYRLAAISKDCATALTAAILVSSLAFFLYFLRESRPYALLATLSGLVLWSYWKALSRGGPMPRWRCLALFLTSALLLYTHYFGAFVLAAVGVYHLFLARWRANWWLVTLTAAAAVLTFAAWLPIALPALINTRHDLSNTRFSFLSASYAIAAVFSNGLVFPPLVAGAIVILKRKRLSQSETYITFVAFTAAVLAVATNEFIPFIVDNRLRYLHILAIPIVCSTAIALKYAVSWRMLRPLIIGLWIAACFIYTESDAFGVFSGRRVQDVDRPVHLQDFVYESERVPSQNGIILAYYPIESGAVEKRLRYYRSALSDWDTIVNVWQDKKGAVEILTDESELNTLEGIAANSSALWVIHNPRRTDFESTDVYQSWLTRRYQWCKRLLEKTESVIDVYVKQAIPCDLVTDDAPWRLHYENGTQLANVEYGLSPNELVVYLWWRDTIDGVYSLSLQLFDAQSNKVGQLDAVIAEDPIDIFSFDISALASGEYSLQMIVYDFVSKRSQSGIILDSQQRFERALEIAGFEIGG